MERQTDVTGYDPFEGDDTQGKLEDPQGKWLLSLRTQDSLGTLDPPSLVTTKTALSSRWRDKTEILPVHFQDTHERGAQGSRRQVELSLSGSPLPVRPAIFRRSTIDTEATPRGVCQSTHLSRTCDFMRFNPKPPFIRSKSRRTADPGAVAAVRWVDLPRSFGHVVGLTRVRPISIHCALRHLYRAAAFGTGLPGSFNLSTSGRRGGPATTRPEPAGTICLQPLSVL